MPIGGLCDFLAPGEAVKDSRTTNFCLLYAHFAQPIRNWYGPIRLCLNGHLLSTRRCLKAIPSTCSPGLRKLLRARSTCWPVAGLVVSPRRLAAPVSIRLRILLPPIEGTISLRLHSPQAEEPNISASNAEAEQLARAYQLVTKQTNFLLVHERAEAEKALDMPVLHKGAQMMLAGWVAWD